MKKLSILLALSVGLFLGSCSSTSGLSSIFPETEATTLAENMGIQLGLTALQKSTVYTSLLSYFTQKSALINQVKNNSMTQAAYNIALSKLDTQKATTIKSVLNNTQLKQAESLFGIK